VEEILESLPSVSSTSWTSAAIPSITFLAPPASVEKGSVEIIKRFLAPSKRLLDRANEVKKKTYRESLQNNRDTILFSKSMATIDTNVPLS